MNENKRLDEVISTVTSVLMTVSLMTVVIFWVFADLRQVKVFAVLTGGAMMAVGVALSIGIIRKLRRKQDWLFVVLALVSGLYMILGKLR